MKCRLEIGSRYYDLAGSDGASSDTQGLRVDYSVNSETVNYIGVTESRNYARPGSAITASFSSVTAFASVSDCEAEIGSLYEFLKDQSGTVTAYLGDIVYDGTNQVETATASGTVRTQVTITQADATAIHYTTDGTDPTTGSPTIASGSSFLQAGTFRVKALAVKTGEANSAIICRGFIESGGLPEVSVSPESSAQPAGTVTVTVTNPTAGATSHYTTDGTDPTTSSPTVASGGTVSVPVPGQLRVLSASGLVLVSPIKEVNFISLPAASGYTTGTYVDGGTTYRWHKLTADAIVRINTFASIDYLIAGGGGAGGGRSGGRSGGGGGAGRLIAGSVSASAQTYSAVIGKGGISSTTSPATSASDGTTSWFFGLNAFGGGGGGVGAAQNGRSANGSGGGGTGSTGIGGGSILGLGFAGGDGGASAGFLSGGGGSSTAVGQTQSGSTTDRVGRAGTTSALDNISTVYCNGGGVLSTATTLTPGSGGAGRIGTDGDAGQNGADGIIILRHVDSATTIDVYGPVASSTSITPSSTDPASGTVLVSVTVDSITQSFNVPVFAGQAASTWAATARAQLAASYFINRDYTVSRSGASIILTSRTHRSDSSLNIATANGSPSAGITPVSTSSNTAPGSPDTITPKITIHEAIAQVSAGYRGLSLSIDASITGRTTAP
jgi:hypothetical protein